MQIGTIQEHLQNFLDCAAAAGLYIPLFRRQQKADSLCFWAQTVSLSLSLMLPCRGTLLSGEQGGTAPRSCRLLHKGITH